MFSFLYCRNATNCIRLQTFYKSLTKNVRQQDSICSKSFHFSFNYSFRVNNVREFLQQRNRNKFQVNSNIKNNVLLYKYENPRYFGVFKIFCLGWILSASILAYYTYDKKFALIWTKDISWTEYMKITGTNLMYFLYATIVGPSALLLLYLVHKKFVKYIILHQGGANVSIITHHLFKRQDILTLPVNKVTAVCGRNRMKDYLPLKVEGQSFYYLLDADGKFLNEELFDCTLGTQNR